MKKMLAILTACALLFSVLIAEGKTTKKNRLSKQEITKFNKPVDTAIQSGVAYLMSQINDKGACEIEMRGRKMADPGITSLVLKALADSGLSKDDKRVKAALTWISDNYTVEKNPGMKDGNMGLYYYFQVLSKTFTVLEIDTVTDSAGIDHDWKGELSAKVISLQKEDGSWQNTNGRFFENVKPLTTAYALVALSNCRK